jgi:hypothetical protein
VLTTFTLLSCKKEPMEVTSTETRTVLSADKPVKLFASSDERFRAAVDSPVQGDAPADWLSRPGTEFRLLNYAFGASGSGEVYVSRSMGSVLDNVNRWLKQFEQKDLDQVEVDALEKVSMLGGQAVWVQAEGSYASGMGKPTVEGFALAGTIVQVGADIYTVKMVGPKDEVAAERVKLAAFVKSLRMAE